MTRLRALLSLVLALTVALSAAVEAGSRIQRVGAMEVVICGGHGGMQTLWLDGQGEPMAPPHDCPNCLPALLAVLPDLALPLAPQGIGRVLAPRAGAMAIGAKPPAQSARDPPPGSVPHQIT